MILERYASLQIGATSGGVAPGRSPRVVLAPGRLIWLVLATAWLATFSMRPVLDPDEGRYAEIPREMVQTGDWVTPRLNGAKYFEKPALQYWATAVAYSIFGVSEGASRLWSVVLSFLCLPLVAAFTLASGGSRGLSARAPALLAVNPYFAALGQINLLDQAFAFFCCFTLFAFVLAQLATRGNASERNWMLCAWAGLALAVLSKGIVAIVLMAAALTIYMILERDLSPLRRMHFRAGVPTFLIIAAPWFWMVQARNPEFASFFFVHEHFERFLTTVHRRVEPFWYFVPLLLLAVLPVLGTANRAISAAWRDVSAPPGGFKTRRFLLIWSGTTILFFSMSQSKLAPYILPVMPPLAVLLAAGIEDDLRAARRAAWIVLGVIATLAVGLVIYDGMRNRVPGLVVPGWSTLAVGCALLPWIVWRVRAHLGTSAADLNEPRNRWAPVALASILGMQALLLGYSALAPARSGRVAAGVARQSIKPTTDVFSVGQYRPSVSFYLARHLRLVGYKGELAFGLGLEPLGYIEDLEAFAKVWTASSDALAFVEPGAFATLRDSGLPGRVLATGDGRSVLVSRR